MRFVIELLCHLTASMLRLVAAAGVTVLLAFPLGWAAYRNRAVRCVVRLLCALPVMALLPVLMLLFGIGESSKLVLLTLSGLWVCAMRLSAAFARLRRYLLPFTVNRFPRGKALHRIVLPLLRQDLAEAFRQTFLVSITLLLFAENYGTRYGVGYYINHAWQAFDYAGVAWGILLAAMMGIFCNGALRVAAGKAVWRLKQTSSAEPI